MMCVCKYFEHSRRRAILHDFQSSFVPREAESEETYEEQTKLFVFLSAASFSQFPRSHACRGIPQTVKQGKLTQFRYRR